MTSVRVAVYESDPLATFVERVTAENNWHDYYEIPESLILACEAAERQLDEARAAVEKYIADNHLPKHAAEYD